MFSDNLEGWDVIWDGREIEEEGTYVYLCLIHIVVLQKPIQHREVIIL